MILKSQISDSLARRASRFLALAGGGTFFALLGGGFIEKAFVAPHVCGETVAILNQLYGGAVLTAIGFVLAVSGILSIFTFRKMRNPMPGLLY